jgi:hypothetical protein
MFLEKLWKPAALLAFVIVTALLWNALGLFALVAGAIAAGVAYASTMLAFAVRANVRLDRGESPISVFDVK